MSERQLKRRAIKKEIFKEKRFINNLYDYIDLQNIYGGDTFSLKDKEIAENRILELQKQLLII